VKPNKSLNRQPWSPSSTAGLRTNRLENSFGGSLKNKNMQVFIALAVFLLSCASISSATAIENSACLNIGSQKTINGIQYTCKKTGTSKKWTVSKQNKAPSTTNFTSAGKLLQNIYPQVGCQTRINLSTKSGKGSAVLGINDTSAECSSQESFLGNFILIYTDKVDISKRTSLTKTWKLSHITLKTSNSLFEIGSDSGDAEWLIEVADLIREKYGASEVIRVLTGPGPNCKDPEDQITSQCRIHYKGIFTSRTAIEANGNCPIPGYQIKVKTYYADGGWVVENTSPCSISAAYTGLLKCTWKDQKNKKYTDEVLTDRLNHNWFDLEPGEKGLVVSSSDPQWNKDCQALAKPYLGVLDFGKELVAWVTTTK